MSKNNFNGTTSSIVVNYSKQSRNQMKTEAHFYKNTLSVSKSNKEKKKLIKNLETNKEGCERPHKMNILTLISKTFSTLDTKNDDNINNNVNKSKEDLFKNDNNNVKFIDYKETEARKTEEDVRII